MMSVGRRDARRREACCSCFRYLFKLFNFLLAFVGLALTLFAIWNLCKLSDSYNLHRSPYPPPLPTTHKWQLPDAWFVYFLLGLGVIVCLISLVGLIAAETSNGCCLSSYIFFLILLALLQGAFVAEVFLNEHWEEAIPDDPTGVMIQIKDFVEDNLYFCKCLGLTTVVIEVFALVSAFCIRATIRTSDWESYDSDDEYILPRARLRQPLLIPQHTADRLLTTHTGTVEGWPINRS